MLRALELGSLGLNPGLPLMILLIRKTGLWDSDVKEQ